MKLATTTGDFSMYTSSQTEAMAYIRRAGFRFLDYCFIMDYINKTGIYADDPKKHIENVKKKAEELEMSFVQAHAPLGAPIAEDNGDFIRDTAKCIKACGELGIPDLVVHSGYAKGLTKEETIEKNCSFYKQLLPLAEEYGVNILTENFNKMSIENLYWIDNAPDLLALIEYVDHPLFHAVWDTGHANMQEMPQDVCLKLLGKHVRALHVQDNFGNTDAHMPPFFGTMSLDALMHGLEEIAYKGYFTFEAENAFCPAQKRRTSEKDDRLLCPPPELRVEAEKLLYAIGRHILSAYGCFEI